ncbi:MAG: hypothetical protein MUO31_07940 [Thermodesulfovibrionales bacterium]|nr:hypothetical protein [Thermodesulfovibrionales bacterium]
MAQYLPISVDFAQFIATAAKNANITSIRVRGYLNNSDMRLQDDCVQVASSKIPARPFKAGRMIVDGIVVSAVAGDVPLDLEEKLHLLEGRATISVESVQQFVQCPCLKSILFQLDNDTWDLAGEWEFEPNRSVLCVTLIFDYADDDRFLAPSVSIIRQAFPNAAISVRTKIAEISRGNIFPSKVKHSPELSNYVKDSILTCPDLSCAQFVAIFQRCAWLNGNRIAIYRRQRDLQILTLDECMPLEYDAPETLYSENNVWLGDKLIAACFGGDDVSFKSLQSVAVRHGEVMEFNYETTEITLNSMIIMPKHHEHLVYVEFLLFNAACLEMLDSMPQLLRLAINSTEDIPIGNFIYCFPSIKLVEMPKMTNNAAFLAQFPNVGYVVYEPDVEIDTFRHMYSEFSKANLLKVLRLFGIVSDHSESRFHKRLQNKINNIKIYITQLSHPQRQLFFRKRQFRSVFSYYTEALNPNRFSETSFLQMTSSVDCVIIV